VNVVVVVVIVDVEVSLVPVVDGGIVVVGVETVVDVVVGGLVTLVDVPKRCTTNTAILERSIVWPAIYDRYTANLLCPTSTFRITIKMLLLSDSCLNLVL